MFEVERETERGVFMTLELKNIGMIKEANVELDGLTVIAGKNDTGKSTVGKFFFVILKTLFSSRRLGKIFLNSDGEIDDSKVASSGIKYQDEINEFVDMLNLVFKTSMLEAEVVLIENKKKIVFNVIRGNQLNFEPVVSLSYEPIIIETPLIWNFTDFFRDIAQIESQMRIELDYPYLMKDLNFKLHIKSASKGLDIKEKVTSLMGGEFKKDEMGRYYFDKKGQRIELVNTATGIKYFGIFQILSQNNYLNKDTVLVLDEPEVHLHPKWQLEMAKIIVELVKNGVKIVVNSHSPYMIEALQRYGKKSKIDMDFYLAENGIIDKIDNNNSATLSKIFEKLSEPFDIFDEMDSETLRNG